MISKNTYKFSISIQDDLRFPIFYFMFRNSKRNCFQVTSIFLNQLTQFAIFSIVYQRAAGSQTFNKFLKLLHIIFISRKYIHVIPGDTTQYRNMWMIKEKFRYLF